MNDAAEMAAGAASNGHGKLQWRILIGFLAGTIAGLAAYTLSPGAAWIDWLVTYVTGPVGQIFLRLLFMLVIPLLFSALVVGIAEMGEVRQLRNVGLRTLVYTVAVSSIAVVISLAAVNLLRPGDGVDPAAARRSPKGRRRRGGHRRGFGKERGRHQRGACDRAQQHHRGHERQRYPGGDVLRAVLRHWAAAGPDVAHRDIERRHRRVCSKWR